MAEQAGSSIGRYRLARRLGAGGMGSVWLADDTTLGRQVALKAIGAMHGLSEEERGARITRARLEAEHAARLSHHPHVAGVLDILEHDGLPWIVMEYVPGATDLGAVVQRDGPLPDAEVAHIGAAVLSALSAGHQVGIIHRDVKPANILLAPDQTGRPYGRVSLTDYGISLHTDSPRLTQGVIGTPGFLAPERIRGADPSPASDLFALGVTLYVASQGGAPFRSTEGPAGFVAPLLETPQPLDRAGAELASVIMGLLEKDPALRLTAERCEQALTGIAVGRPSAPAAGPVEPTVQDTPAPVQDTSAPVQDTPAPARDTPAPVQDTPTPGQSAPAPAQPIPDHAQPTATTPQPPATPRPSAQVPSTPPPSSTPERPVQPPATPQFPPAFPPSDQLATPPARTGSRPLRRPLTVGLAALVTLGVIVAAAVFLPRLGENGSSGSGGQSSGGSGGQNPGSGGSDGGSGGSTAGNKVVTIAVDAPLTGDLAALGIGIKNSVDLAVRKANSSRLVDGITFQVKAVDDRAQPANGQQNATSLVADKDVLGVVGPLNASIAQSMQAPLDAAQLALVSPATSNPLLTLGNDWQTGEPKRPFASFFRTAPLDPMHGSIAAQYLYRDKDRRKAYVIDNTGLYGVGIADAFKEEFTRLGGRIVGVDHVSPETRDFAAVTDEVASSGADVVYYGGEYPAGGPLCAQLKDAAADTLFAGGDGLYATEFVKAAQQGGQGAYVTSVLEAANLPSGKDFVKRYKAADYQDEYGSYGAYAYDAAWALIQAIKATVDANDGKLPTDARPKVVAALQRVSFDGVTGPVAFDRFGDTTSKRLGVYTVENGRWKLAKPVSYEN